MGIKTDVIESGICKFQNYNDAFNKKIRPLEAGYSVSIMSLKLASIGDISVGTIGCIVKKLDGNKIKYYILSNNHVLTCDNFVSMGVHIIQPAFQVHLNAELEC